MSDKQDKAIKLALASAIAAKKASEMKQIFPNGSPNSSSIRLQKQENGRNEVESKEEKPKICCKRCREWMDQHENLFLGIGFLFALIVLMIWSF